MKHLAMEEADLKDLGDALTPPMRDGLKKAFNFIRTKHKA